MKTKPDLKDFKVPKLPLLFFRWFCHPRFKDYIEGDLIEVYERRLKKSGKWKATYKLIIDVFLLFRPSIIREIKINQPINSADMYKNYFKVGIRNIMKYKVFSFINVFGLAAAMSVSMLIILMLEDQHSYDQFHENKENVYRILSDGEGFKQAYATTPFPLANELKSSYTNIKETTNLTPNVGGDATYNGQTTEMRGYFAQPSFFKIFSFELLEGDQDNALSKPNSMVISKAIAERLFKNENPIGKTLEFYDRKLSFPQDHDGIGASPVFWGSYTVTGVIDIEHYRSHLRFDVLVSESSMPILYAEQKLEDRTGDWEWYYRTYSYAMMEPDKTETDLNVALDELVKRKYENIVSDQTKGFKLKAQALGDIALGLVGNDTDNRMPSIGYFFLALLALVIMVTACLNYTNLSIARALTRAKEIGVRKVTGAGKWSLISQFLVESVLTSLLALILALGFLVLIKPAFRSLWVNQYLNFEFNSSFLVYAVFLGFAILIGLIAGAYPAFHLSSFKPIKVLKSLHETSPGKLGLRKVLSISQFVITLFIIVTSILIYNQFRHYIQFDYGFATKNIVNIELQGADYHQLTNNLNSIPEVTDISATDIIPATGRSNGMEIRKYGSESEFLNSSIINIDDRFINNLELKILAGANLPPKGTTSERQVIVNEKIIKELGYTSPAAIIGELIENRWNNEQLEVIGVVEDFRYKLLINSDEIGPLILRNSPSQFQYLNVKVSSNNLMETVEKLEEQWKKVDPMHPFKYTFFDQELADTHKGIFDLVAILVFIAILSISISCLGLLGMTIYTAERKKKEVGIRKILGATDRSIALLLSKEFLLVLLISIGIGAPLSFLANNFWLQLLPNRVEFGLGTVLLAVFILLSIGIFTILTQTFRIVKSNPVDSLNSD